MRVIAKSVLREFWNIHQDCEQPLKAWYKEAEEAHWKGSAAVKREFPSASILQGNRVVFNIKGNKYRLVVRVNYDYGVIWIRFIGTHNAYAKINSLTI